MSFLNAALLPCRRRVARVWRHAMGPGPRRWWSREHL